MATITDDFNRADGALNGDTTTTGSKTWSGFLQCVVASNECAISGLVASYSACTIDVGAKDYTATLDIRCPTVNEYAVVMCRIASNSDVASGGNFVAIEFRHNGTGAGQNSIRIRDITGGTSTNTDFTLPDSHLTTTRNWTVDCNGTTIEAYETGNRAATLCQATGVANNNADDTLFGFGKYTVNVDWFIDNLSITTAGGTSIPVYMNHYNRMMRG